VSLKKIKRRRRGEEACDLIIPLPTSRQPVTFSSDFYEINKTSLFDIPSMNMEGTAENNELVVEEAGKANVSEDETAKKAAATKADEVCLRVRERTFGELWQ
jgi:hypothetical protein